MTAAISPLHHLYSCLFEIQVIQPIRLLAEATLVPAGCSQFSIHDIPHGQFTTSSLLLPSQQEKKIH